MEFATSVAVWNYTQVCMESSRRLELKGVFMALFSKDTYEKRGDICKVTFMDKGVLTKKRVDKILLSSKLSGYTKFEIVLSDKVTEIGDGAFAASNFASKPKELISVKIPKSVLRIGDNAFLKCRGFEKIEIPTEVKEIGESAFAHCDTLKQVFLTQGPVKIGKNAFKCCNSLEEIELPEAVILEEGVFEDCKCLVRAKLPSDLREIPNGLFEGCSSLNAITIPEGTEKIGSRAFYGCTSLGEAVLPSTLDSIGADSFVACQSLAEIIIPKSVTKIGENAFLGCEALTVYSEASDEGENWSPTWNSTGCPVVWEHCGLSFESEIKQRRKLVNDGDDGNVLIIDKDTCAIRIAGKGALTKEVAQAELSREEIQDCSKIYIKIGGEITEIESGAFEGCEKISYVMVGDTVAKIGEKAFFDCAGLLSFEMGRGTEELGESALEGCVALNTVVLSPALTKIGKRAFFGCGKLIHISAPNEKASLPRGVSQISDSVFEGCSSLSRIILGDGLKEIGKRAFCACLRLSYVDLSPALYKIGEGAFENCKKVSEIHIPQGTEEIEKHAFLGCGTMKIYCRAEKKPKGWSPAWAGDYCRIIWNSK